MRTKQLKVSIIKNGKEEVVYYKNSTAETRKLQKHINSLKEEHVKNPWFFNRDKIERLEAKVKFLRGKPKIRTEVELREATAAREKVLLCYPGISKPTLKISVSHV